MNDFDQRWRTTTQAARRHADTSAELPYGFTTRVLAHFENNTAESWSDLITALGLRAVLTSALLFAVSTVIVIWQMDLTPTWIETPLSPQLFLP